MLLKTIASFFKIGCISFGGGTAVTPVVEDEIVDRNRYLKKELFVEHTIISNITPGALPVKLGALAGFEMSGIAGMAAGAITVALPGVAATILFLAMLSSLGREAVHQIELASVGISIFIINLLLEYIAKVQKDSSSSGFGRPGLLLMILAAFTASGEELIRLVQLFSGIDFWKPEWSVPGLSTINVLILCFFIIFFTGGYKKKWRIVLSAVITSLYFILFREGSAFHAGGCGIYLRVAMVALAGVFVVYDSRKEAGQTIVSPDLKLLIRKIAVFIIIIAVCCIPAFILSQSQADFIADCTLTSVTSFGAGQACLTVADSIFVDTGKVSSSAFYGQILPVTNALPGPLLVKILSSFGYYIGNENGGPALGLTMAVAGFGIAIGSTCIICILVQTLYQCFCELRVFYLLKLWILPVICGLLIKVILSMMNELLGIAEAEGMLLPWAVVFCLGLFAFLRLLGKRFHMNDIFVIVIAGAASAAVLNLI